MDDEERYRHLRVHPWWVVVGSLAVVVAVLAAIWWQPLTDLVGPNWTETAWHLVAADDARLVVAVEDVLCEPEEEPGPVRLEVVERGEQVIVEAQRQTGGLPFVPRACPAHYELVTAEADLDAPLANRALYGCRLADSGTAAELGVEGHDCREVPEPLR